MLKSGHLHCIAFLGRVGFDLTMHQAAQDSHMYELALAIMHMHGITLLVPRC